MLQSVLLADSKRPGQLPVRTTKTPRAWVVPFFWKGQTGIDTLQPVFPSPRSLALAELPVPLIITLNCFAGEITATSTAGNHSIQNLQLLSGLKKKGGGAAETQPRISQQLQSFQVSRTATCTLSRLGCSDCFLRTSSVALRSTTASARQRPLRPTSTTTISAHYWLR